MFKTLIIQRQLFIQDADIEIVANPDKSKWENIQQQAKEFLYSQQAE